MEAYVSFYNWCFTLAPLTCQESSPSRTKEEAVRAASCSVACRFFCGTLCAGSTICICLANALDIIFTAKNFFKHSKVQPIGWALSEYFHVLSHLGRRASLRQHLVLPCFTMLQWKQDEVGAHKTRWFWYVSCLWTVTMQSWKARSITCEMLSTMEKDWERGLKWGQGSGVISPFASLWSHNK